MSDNENDERQQNASGRADDAAHPFDQTNGMVDGLEGDADAPEKADDATGNPDGVGLLAAPAPGAQMAGGVIPAVVAGDRDADDDADADADDPSTP